MTFIIWGAIKEAFDLFGQIRAASCQHKDFALIEGYVHARSGELQEALSDFSRALERDLRWPLDT